MESPSKYFHIIKKSLLLTYPNLTEEDFAAIADNLKQEPGLLKEFDDNIDNLKSLPIKQMTDDELAQFFMRAGVLLNLVQVNESNIEKKSN